jgi:hypothetical protein
MLEGVNISKSSLATFVKEEVGRNKTMGADNTMVPESMGVFQTAGGIIQPVATVQERQNAFKADMRDFIFALVAFALGYLFSRWVFFAWHGWGVAAFTAGYLLSVTVYLIRKGAFVNCAASWFWLAVTWATGASYLLWENVGIAYIRALFLFCAATYYVIIASGRAIMGKTGNFLIVDGLNSVIIIPFRNFINQYVSFGVIKKKERKHAKIVPVLLGVALALLLAACLIPLLERADSGGFSMILRFFVDIFSIRWETVTEILFYSMCGIPIAAYLYGLVTGAAHNKGTDIIESDSVKGTVAALRLLQPATVFIALGTVCGLYIIFILCQIPYFFSAFTGSRPEGWLNYAEYARRGFFELCGIVVINLIIVTVGNIISRKPRADSRMLKAFNIALASITLILVATAFSKLALYIDAHGLSILRLLPCVFMVFLASVFVALIILQKWNFSIVRYALVTGSILICVLCLSNPDALVVRYNTDRYLSGTLSEYDTEILNRAGRAGVLPALEVYEKTADAELRQNIGEYLENQGRILGIYPDSTVRGNSAEHKHCIESYLARERLQRFRN